MTAILGIDAAWTDSQPSGVALLQRSGSQWRTVCVAPSYDAFIAASRGEPIDWMTRRFSGSSPNIPMLLSAARRMADDDLAVVAVDMPLATVPITMRRHADREVSRAFGSRRCSTHSPTASRPGLLAERVVAQLLAEGIPLGTSGETHPSAPCAIEVYPHPALLTLLQRTYRVPYKISRAARYWPGTSVPDRVERLLAEFDRINCALGSILGRAPLRLPSAAQVPRLAQLKRYEDALDALVCAWVGACFLDESVAAFGDELAAIWVPTTNAVQPRTAPDLSGVARMACPRLAS